MNTKHYERPETDVIPMLFPEDICQNPSGKLFDYNKRDDIDLDWDDDE